VLKKKRQPDLLETPELDIPQFTAKEVVRILEIEEWRLQKFLNSPQYQLSASGRLGRGRGSRRLFSRADILRFGVADHLVRDGFSPRFVADALQQIEDEELEGVGREGEPVDMSVIFSQRKGGAVARFIRRNEISTALSTEVSSYFLDLPKLTGRIEQRIFEALTKRVSA